MSALVALAIAIAGAAGAIARALLIDQVRGQIQRHLTQSVESTIASLPDDLQAEWGEEWRAELAACIAMPLTAARFARGLRARAHKLVDVLEPAVPTNVSSHRLRRWLPLPRAVVRRTLPREFLAGCERVLSRVDMSVAEFAATGTVVGVGTVVGAVGAVVVGVGVGVVVVGVGVAIGTFVGIFAVAGTVSWLHRGR